MHNNFRIKQSPKLLLTQRRWIRPVRIHHVVPKKFCPFASSCQIPKTSKTLAKTFDNFQKRKCSPVEKTFCWDCWKTSCTGVDKRRQTSPQKRSHQKLIQFAVQIASSANEFHRKRSSFPKSWCQNLHASAFKFRCLHIVLHHVQSSVQPHCQKHQSIATIPVTCRSLNRELDFRLWHSGKATEV